MIYARVSTAQPKADLIRQLETWEHLVLAPGLKIARVGSDIASGINFEKRKPLFSRLDLRLDRQVSPVVISYQDRFSRVGLGLFKHLFLQLGTEIRVANGHVNEK